MSEQFRQPRDAPEGSDLENILSLYSKDSPGVETDFFVRLPVQGSSFSPAASPLQIRLTPIPRALFKHLPGHILISCWVDTQLLYTSSTIQAIQSRVPLVLSLKATHRGIA